MIKNERNGDLMRNKRIVTVMMATALAVTSVPTTAFAWGGWN